jgi:hypothetical protein
LLFCLSVVATRAAISISVSITAAPRPTATTTAEATARPAATAATARAIVALAGRTRLGHADFPPVDHLAIQAADSLGSTLVRRHFDESKSS